MRPMIGLDLQAGTGGERAGIDKSIVTTAPAWAGASAFEMLDVQGVATELVASARTARDAVVERVLVDDEALTLRVVALRRGGGIAEHAAPHTVVLAPIVGRLRLARGNGIVDLVPGRVMFLGCATAHAIVADEDAAFMLVTAKR